MYRVAQANDPSIASARYALDSARQKIPLARAGLRPVATVTGNEGATHAETAFSDQEPVNRAVRAWSWNLQVTQPVLRVGALYAIRESEFIVDQAEAQYAQARQDLLLRVAQAYFGVIVAQDAIGAAQAQVSALDEQLAQVTRGFQHGTHAVTDVDDTKSRQGSARAQLVSAQNDLDSAQANLEKITGQVPTELAVLQSTMMPPPPTADSRAWMAQARTNHPLVRAQRAALDAARQAIKKLRSDHLPTLDLVANTGSNFSSRSLATPNDYATRANQRQIGLQLTVPLYSGGAVDARVTEAIANMDKATADLELASRQSALDARLAYAGVVNGLAQIAALDVAVASGQSALKGNRAGYRLGIRINIDVLNAEQQVFAAQRDLSKARYETLLQGLKLKAAAGALDEYDLLKVNSMLR
ncbi:TolC family outer membrane protein [Massilia sp. TWP1-3-3]|uniref:TolC family outer membrane protein n=1 Tax=Massilia sp. TWP1-3-3 TaxID=2804573 RepID=UPI003CEB861D